MRTLFRICILTLTILTLCFRAKAEDRRASEQLDSIVEDVVTTNPEIQYYEAEIAKAKGGVFNAQKLPNPELELDVGRKDSSTSGVNQGQGVAWGVSFAQTFEYPGRIELREAIARKEVKLAEIQLSKFKLALTNKAKSLALDLYFAQQNKQSTEAVASKVRSLVDVLSKREIAGPALQLERKIIEAAALSLKQRANQFAGEAEKLAVELNAFRGMDINSRYAVVINLERQILLPRNEELIAMALENNPQLILKKAELEQQGLKVKLSENEQNPSFTIRPFYSQEDAGDLERIVGVGFSVPLPIWNDNSGNISKERAGVDQLTASLRTLEREVKGNVSSLQASYKAVSNQLTTINNSTINDLRKSSHEAEEQYQLGAIPLTTYLQLQEQYLDNLSLYRASQIQRLKLIADVELTTGLPLSKGAFK